MVGNSGSRERPEARYAGLVLDLTTIAALDVSAASGLVALGDRLCVVADDETFLAVFALDGTPLTRIALVADALPATHAERKRHKPDFEALALLPDGCLLALGSGSTEARMRGAWVEPWPGARARSVDLAPLYARLRAEVPELNVEGAAVAGDALWLLQRGNGPARFNACIELDLARVLGSLAEHGRLDATALRAITRVTLGDLDGVPLSFTDAVAWPGGGLLFSAAAEDSPDTVADGPCAGSVVGVLSEGRIIRASRVRPLCKIEGIALACRGRDRAAAPEALWLVADADDRQVPASLFRATLPFA